MGLLDDLTDPAWRERNLRRLTPGTFLDDFSVGLDRIVFGRVGDPSAQNPGQFNPTFGDAARSTLDTFTPDIIYEGPPRTGPGNIFEQGTQTGDFDPTGNLKLGAEWVWGIAALGAALLLRVKT